MWNPHSSYLCGHCKSYGFTGTKDISYIHDIERSDYCYRNSSRSHKVSHTHSTLMTGLEMPRLQLEPALEIKLEETTGPV